MQDVALKLISPQVGRPLGVEIMPFGKISLGAVGAIGSVSGSEFRCAIDKFAYYFRWQQLDAICAPSC